MNSVYVLQEDMKKQLLDFGQSGGTSLFNLRQQLAPIWPKDMSLMEFADHIWDDRANCQRVLDVLKKEILRVRITDLVASKKSFSNTYAKLKEEVFGNQYDDLYDLKHTHAQLQKLYDLILYSKEYRHLLNLAIDEARKVYPSAKWSEFMHLVAEYFGVQVYYDKWWEDVSYEGARFYLEMLQEPDLDKVKKKFKSLEEQDLPPPLVEDVVEHTLAQRKAKFLHQLKNNPRLVPLLGSYMSLVVPTLTTISNKTFSVQPEQNIHFEFDDWEAILNKTDKDHIVWQMMDRDMSPDDEEILKGLAELNKSAENSERTVEQRILYFWSIYTENKKELIIAYLKGVPLKEERSKN